MAVAAHGAPVSSMSCLDQASPSPATAHRTSLVAFPTIADVHSVVAHAALLAAMLGVDMFTGSVCVCACVLVCVRVCVGERGLLYLTHSVFAAVFHVERGLRITAACSPVALFYGQ